MSRGPTWAVVTHAMLPNGPSHRLVQALLHDGYDMAFYAIPLPGASRWRAERVLPGAPEILVDEPRSVPPLRELRSAFDVAQSAWQLARSGCREVILVGCDPVSFLEAAAAFRSAPVRVRASAVWFVDWSAQRLQHPATAVAYRWATRGALRLADVTAVIFAPATEALASVGRQRSAIMVLANQALHVGTGPAWAERPLSVAYVGGRPEHQGVDVLLRAAAVLGRDSVAVDIVGDGPASPSRTGAETTANLPDVRFHSMVGDISGLADVLLPARVGWALYDTGFPPHDFNDPLKIKDYLAAGLRVVSTSPRSVDDGAIVTAQCSVPAVAEATRRALAEPPPSEPSVHPLPVDASRSLRAFVSAVHGAR